MKKFSMQRSPLALMLAVCLSTTAHATDYSQMIILGDSLSDTGNLAHQINGNSLVSLLTGEAQASFTTNPDTTWAGVLASSYGLSAKPSTSAGTNYAVGGGR